jgi:tripartite-type tricarboxylate transporter receptor subunit TctC
VPGYQTDAWAGLGAPKDTPAEIVALLNREVRLGLEDARLRARIAEIGAAVLSLSQAEWAKHLADETEKWGKVVKAAGAKAE